jgi:HemY protein
MLRALILFIILAVLGGLAAWLADHPGTLAVDWGGRRIETSLAVAGVAVLALIVVVVIVYRIWRFLVSSPMALAGWRSETRRQRGYTALSRGLVAVAAGDAGEAKKLAKQTEVLLNDPPLTLLLSAQAAQLDGDEAAARQYFEAMRERPETEFLGLRGLLVQARRGGDEDAALALARRAYELRPDTRWVVQELFALETEAGHWAQAQQVVERARKRKLISEADGRRQRMIALYAEALAAEANGEPRRALALARNAHDLVPDFVPATAFLARMLAADGAERKARKLLEDGWRRGPHPALAAAYLGMTGGEDGEARLVAVRKLIAGNPDHEESRLLLAAALLRTAAYDEAGDILETQVRQAPGRRAFRLMADLAENGRGDSAAAGRWLRQAATAPGEAAWVCDGCGRQNADWVPHCPDCGAFDSFQWRRPATALMVDEAEAELLLPARADEEVEEPAAAVAEEDVAPHEKKHLGDIAPTATEP